MRRSGLLALMFKSVTALKLEQVSFNLESSIMEEFFSRTEVYANER